jgi:hypothetical protein
MRHRTCCRKNITANPGSGEVTANVLEFVVAILGRIDPGRTESAP